MGREPTIARKELDLKSEGRKFLLEKEQKRQLMDTIKHDCLFFEGNYINDYSLLVGVHKIEAGEPPASQIMRVSVANVLPARDVRSSSSAAFLVRDRTRRIGFLCGN